MRLQLLLQLRTIHCYCCYYYCHFHTVHRVETEFHREVSAATVAAAALCSDPGAVAVVVADTVAKAVTLASTVVLIVVEAVRVSVVAAHLMTATTLLRPHYHGQPISVLVLLLGCLISQMARKHICQYPC